jgi:hypothetical protein
MSRARYRDIESKSDSQRGWNMISECNSAADVGITYGNVGYTQENDNSIYEIVGLSERALIKYSKTHYNSTVEDVPRFVSSFNEKTPEYERRLGYKTILEVAEKLHKSGRLGHNGLVISLSYQADLKCQKGDFVSCR